MSEMMRSMVITEAFKCEKIMIPKPVRKEGEVLLKLLYAGICGSELSSYRGTFAYSGFPISPGHAFAAEIVEVDEPNEYGLKPGMIVTCNPYFPCGKCRACRHGLFNCCEKNQTMGAHRDGAFCDYFCMPIEKVYDGQGLPPEILALIEPFCISYHGICRGQVQEGDKVLVVGAGTIGVLAAVSAKLKGAEVYICDIAEKKVMSAVENFGLAGGIVNSSPEHFEEEVLRITENMRFDVTVEAVGLPSTFQNCIDAAGQAATVVLIGIAKKNIDLKFSEIQRKELNIYGSRNALKKDFMELIDLVKAGKVDLSHIVSRQYDFEDTPQAFKDFNEDTGNILKILLKF